MIQFITQENLEESFEKKLTEHATYVSNFYYAVGMILYRAFLPNVEFEACKGGYSFAYLYRSLCRCHEWSLLGTRYTLSGEHVMPFSIEHAPGYGFGDVSDCALFTNGVQTLQNELGRKLLLKQMKEESSTKENGMDHGIRAGLWLFDSLARQYWDHYEKGRSEENVSFLSFETKGENGLNFCFGQWSVYVYLAYCLFVHTQMEQYVNLIGKKLAIRENPILFMLVFCENIFPAESIKSDDRLAKRRIDKLNIKVIEKKLVIEMFDSQQLKELLEELIALEHILQIKSIYDDEKKCIVIDVL